MNALKDSILSICFIIIAVGVIEMLVPFGNFKPQMKLITGAVLVISIVSPFLNSENFNFDFDKFNYSVTDSGVTDSLQMGAAISIKESISEIIKKYGVTKAKIKISMDNTTDNSIVINKALILFLEKDIDKTDKLCDEIESRLGIDVEIGVFE